MKIESLGKPIGPPSATEPHLRPDAASVASAGESVKLSPLASSLQKAEAALAETPAVERKRIEEIKQAIREDRFQIDPNRIADGLVAEVRQMLDSQAGRV